MNLLHRIGLAGALALLALGTTPARAEVDDWAADWSTTANPNGPWAYWRGTTLLPNQPTTCCGLPPSTSFAPSTVPGTFLPIFYRPGAPGSDIFVHTYDGFNGGGFVGEATLTWTAASAGTIDVAGWFYYTPNATLRSNLVTVRLGSTVLGSENVSYLQHATPDTRWNFSFEDLAVSAGDVVSVVFQRTPGFSPGAAMAGNLIVTSTAPVPEPATAWLLGIGLAGLAAWRRAALRDGRG